MGKTKQNDEKRAEIVSIVRELFLGSRMSCSEGSWEGERREQQQQHLHLFDPSPQSKPLYHPYGWVWRQ
jgi:hypothetical protein